MKTIFTLLFLVLSIQMNAADGNAVLRDVDSRLYMPNMAFEMDIYSYKGSKLRDSNRIAGYSKDSVKSLVLLYFISPASIKGRKMLMEGNYIWMQMPRTKNAIRLSPMQILLGEASNGDVARTRFSIDYNAVHDGIEVIDGKKCDRLILEVKPEKKGSTYSKIILRVRADKLPFYAEFFAESGKMMKKVYYRSFTPYGAKMLQKKIEIFDAVNSENHTIMEYVKIGSKNLPLSYFTKDYLDRFQYTAFGGN
ncbi:MAG: outer membrane lipoprotein-sorting protein [Spirochaetes bacterium]|nr:outer membrane lipoprotein-sorting protein [Spirochaetota bacterium]